MENSEIPRRIQMERFIPVEIFHKKSNTFWGITIFRFLPKRPDLDYSASCREKAKNWPVFCKWYNSIPFLFSVPKKYQYHLAEIFHRNFRTNGKCSWCLGFELAISRSADRRLSNWATDTMPVFISGRLNFSERRFYQQKTNLVPRSRRLRRQGIWVRDHEKKGMSWEDQVNTSDVFPFYARLKLLRTPCLQFLAFM